MGVNVIMNELAEKSTEGIKGRANAVSPTVFSHQRNVITPPLALAEGLHFNRRLQMDGLVFLEKLPSSSIPVAFFDPQYRGVLDKLGYGNEGKNRGQARASLPQMTQSSISQFIRGVDRVLIPSGHVFLWMDKFHLCTGFTGWFAGTALDVVDMLTWDKGRIGMGYRTRRSAEYLVVLQKQPRRAKGVWQVHNIPDVWTEPVQRGGHTKPVNLQGELIAAVSHEGDVVIDPAAGNFSVLDACKEKGRNFLGCDING